jgi:hypothetical protein
VLDVPPDYRAPDGRMIVRRTPVADLFLLGSPQRKPTSVQIVGSENTESSFCIRAEGFAVRRAGATEYGGNGPQSSDLFLDEVGYPKRLLTKWLQRLAPGDNLVQHGRDRVLLMRRRIQDAEVLEVGEQRQRDLGTYVGDLEFAHHQP